MSWNGSGTFNRLYSWVADAQAGIDISSVRMDADTNDITSNGLGNCLTRDGQGIATANLPMGNFRHTGVGVGVARTDYAAMSQAQDGLLNWGDAGGSANALTATYSPALTALSDGQLCFVRAASANTSTTPTFSPNGLTARTIVKSGGVAVSVGEWTANAELILRYNLANTRWELLNPRGAALSTFTSLTSGSGATFNTPTGARRLRIRMISGGGGGGGTGTASNTSGGLGGTSSFGSVSCIGGSGGATNSGTAAGGGGNGGTGGSGSTSIRLVGGKGSDGQSVNASYAQCHSGAGGNGVFGGAGGAVYATNGASPGASLTGGGGGGAANNSSTSIATAGGGGGGEYVEFDINAPNSSYTYSVGAGGTAGGAGTSGNAGGAGGQGVIYVEAFF